MSESVSTEQLRHVSDGGKTRMLGKEPVPVPLSPPQISSGMVWDQARAGD